MTRSEAIKVLLTESVEIGGNAVSICRFWEALDMAIAALRQQETVTKCTDLFNEDGGDIYQENDSICSSTNLPCCRCNPGPCDHRQEPVTNRNGLNEPLTNAQKIRAMRDEELAKLLCCTGWRMIEQKECLEWLQMQEEEA